MDPPEAKKSARVSVVLQVGALPFRVVDLTVVLRVWVGEVPSTLNFAVYMSGLLIYECERGR